ncbi:MAG TPA: riboflavin kinase [Candidatus Saccharimonadales bacterium]|nr:riboflavin kinase [Candidatus Saccharimonadales bacterium]
MASLRTFSGIIKKYQGNGRQLGYPTANIELKAKAPNGIYLAYAVLDENSQKLPALVFIGAPVTLGDQLQRIETHILDYPDEDLYDRQIMISLIRKLRDNQKFDTIEALKDQMKQDEIAARAYFKLSVKL